MNQSQSTQDALEELDEQDRRLRFDRFDHDDAWEVGSWIVAAARERGHTIATAIWLGEQRVFHASLAGTAADNDIWIERKAAVVRRYDASSMRMMKMLESRSAEPPGARMGVDPIRYAFNGGALPVRIGPTQVGVVVATGVNDYAEHDLVVEALEHRLAAHAAAGSAA
jgi:uncharacterized protein (UPF0303 family)